MTAAFQISQWEKGTLSDLCTLSTESSLPSEAGVSMYVGLEHVDSGSFNLCRWSSPADFRSNAFVFRPRDVLYGKLRPYLDKAVIAPDAGVCSTELLVLRPKPTIPSEFLVAVLHSREFIAYAQSSADKQYPRTSWSWISQYQCAIPGEGECDKIAMALSKVQTAVEVESNLIGVTKELKRAAFCRLFTGGLRSEPRKETRFGSAPASWRELALSECAIVQTGIAKNSKNWQPNDVEVPYLRVANVQDGRLDLGEMKSICVPASDIEGSLLRVGDVVLTEGGDFDKLGRGFIWEGQIERCVHQNHIFAVRTNPNVLDSRYFAYLAQSPYGKAYFLTVAHKTTNLACINTTKLRAFPVLLPDLQEQYEIASILRTIDKKIVYHQERKSVLTELFRTLLRDLMSGRRRITEVNLSAQEAAA